MLRNLPFSSSADMETIPNGGAEIYYEENFLSPELTWPKHGRIRKVHVLLGYLGCYQHLSGGQGADMILSREPTFQVAFRARIATRLPAATCDESSQAASVGPRL
jgi:hypothetical protein